MKTMKTLVALVALSMLATVPAVEALEKCNPNVSLNTPGAVCATASGSHQVNATSNCDDYPEMPQWYDQCERVNSSGSARGYQNGGHGELYANYTNYSDFCYFGTGIFWDSCDLDLPGGNMMNDLRYTNDASFTVIAYAATNGGIGIPARDVTAELLVTF